MLGGDASQPAVRSEEGAEHRPTDRLVLLGGPASWLSVGIDPLVAFTQATQDPPIGLVGHAHESTWTRTLDSVAPRDPSGYDDDLRFALTLADQVDALTLDRFGATDLRVETKPDLTPVTDADAEAERVVRAVLGRTRPRDAVVGEELPPTGHGRRQWVIDPIDGTKNFVRGVPVWATLIALIDDRDPVVGVVSAPALQRRWWAARDIGAYTGRSLSRARRLQVSPVARLEDASLSYSSLSGWEARGLQEPFLELTRRCWRTRAYGDFWSYMLLAEGAVDVACEPELALHDMAALVPIVTEAGGALSSLDGSAAPWGSDALATNGVLHESVRAVLGT